MSQESGNNWEVRRRYVAQERAAHVGRQALWLMNIAQLSSYIRVTESSRIEAHGVTAYEVGAWDPARYPSKKRTLRNDPAAVEMARSLLSLHERATEDVGIEGQTFTLNRYQANSRTGYHRDRYEEKTLAVGLVGAAACIIEDPLEQTWHKFVINPGDAVYFDNPGDQQLRPLHNFINISHDIRVSLVE